MLFCILLFPKLFGIRHLQKTKVLELSWTPHLSLCDRWVELESKCEIVIYDSRLYNTKDTAQVTVSPFNRDLALLNI